MPTPLNPVAPQAETPLVATLLAATPLAALPPELWPNIDHIQTEDGASVGNGFSEKQMRLLTESLHSSWKPDCPFVAFANVGLFYGVNLPPLVPDVLLSLNVRLPEDLRPKLNRSYFVWGYGKPPEVAIEIVSNKEGREDGEKLKLYADVRVANYFIFDPECFISKTVLRGYQLVGDQLEPLQDDQFIISSAGLGLCLWRGRYEDTDATWFRWTDADRNLIPTGAELASIEREKAFAESQRADAESQRANEIQRENERLARLLRDHGIDS